MLLQYSALLTLHYNRLRLITVLSCSRLGYREVDYSHAFREHEFRFEMTAVPQMEYQSYVNEDEV